MSKLLKISREKAEEFGLPTANKFLGFEIANYYLEKIDSGRTKGVMYYVKVKIPVYLVLCIPLHAIQFLECVWDGGIRYFCFCDNEITRNYINNCNSYYNDIVKLCEASEKK